MYVCAFRDIEHISSWFTDSWFFFYCLYSVQGKWIRGLDKVVTFIFIL